MIKITNNSMCSGCSACYNICPQQCIHMKEDSEGFFYPEIDSTKCINCGLCEKTCPFREQEIKRKACDITYVLKNKDNNVRSQSSSGGVFYEIGKYVLENQGIVYGAVYSQNFRKVSHVGIDTLSELNKLQKSKYIQSDISSCFSEIKNYLKSGRLVLFSGTPCQINGIKSYLQHDYENLITVEVICHGVPSYLFWSKYLDSFEKKHGQIADVDMRSKQICREENGLIINNSIFERINDNLYLRLFNGNFGLRPSCFECKVKESESKADICIGDAWGISSFCPELHDSYGASVCLLYTPKGIDIFTKIKSAFDYRKIDYSIVTKFNKSITKSADKPKLRDEFYVDINKSLRYYEIKYLYPGVKGKIKYVLKTIGLYSQGVDSELNYGINITYL